MSLAVCYHLGRTKFLLDTLGFIRLCQYVRRDSGEFDGCCLVHTNDNHSKSGQHCVRERGTLGPLGQSFLKQGRSWSAQCFIGASFLFCSGHSGLLVYVIMTTLNTLTIGIFFRWEVVKGHPRNQLTIKSYHSSYLSQEAAGFGPWFAYILPSALVIVFFLPSYLSVVDSCPLASHVDCTCDALCKVLTVSDILFFSECWCCAGQRLPRRQNSVSNIPTWLTKPLRGSM